MSKSKRRVVVAASAALKSVPFAVIAALLAASFGCVTVLPNGLFGDGVDGDRATRLLQPGNTLGPGQTGGANGIDTDDPPAAPPIDWAGIGKEVFFGAIVIGVGALMRELDPRRRLYLKNGK